MDFLAITEGFKAIPDDAENVHVVSSSRYAISVCNGAWSPTAYSELLYFHIEQRYGINASYEWIKGYWCNARSKITYRKAYVAMQQVRVQNRVPSDGYTPKWYRGDHIELEEFYWTGKTPAPIFEGQPDKFGYGDRDYDIVVGVYGKAASYTVYDKYGQKMITNSLDTDEVDETEQLFKISAIAIEGLPRGSKINIHSASDDFIGVSTYRTTKSFVGDAYMRNWRAILRMSKCVFHPISVTDIHYVENMALINKGAIS